MEIGDVTVSGGAYDGQTIAEAVITSGASISVIHYASVNANVADIVGGVPLVALPFDTTGTFAVLVILAAATGIGVLNGLGVTLLRVHPMIMTLAMATLLQGVLIIIAGGSAVSAQNPLVAWLGNARLLSIPASVYVWFVVSAVALVVLHAPPFGARIYALGANPLASALSGIGVGATTTAVYAISGFTAGLAGIVVLGMNGQGYVGIGDQYLLASIAAVVLGGTSILGGAGTYAGTIPGAILLVTISALITVVNASAGWRNILFGSLILALLLLSGREARRR
jgi:ribose transport system permease protein